MSCTASYEEPCCLHELPNDHQFAPGTVCCWCGDIYGPLDERETHGEYKPVTFTVNARTTQGKN